MTTTDLDATPAPALAPWLVDHDGLPALAAGRCQDCGRSHVPAREVCPSCGHATVVSEPRPEGVVVASTTTFLPVPGGEGHLHTVVLVDLGEGLLAAGRLRSPVDKPTGVSPGMQVAVAVQELGDSGLLGHCFQRAEGSDDA